MSFSVRELFSQVEPDPSVVDRLTNILCEAGFEDATDIAMTSDGMVESLLQSEAEALGGGAPYGGGCGTPVDGGVGNKHQQGW